jgi:hypothetical protein
VGSSNDRAAASQTTIASAACSRIDFESVSAARHGFVALLIAEIRDHHGHSDGAAPEGSQRHVDRHR